ncbi:hypothetical protein MNBD_GAMMA18-751 [hydrothermal vent metagenome]|uniref:Pyridoxamine 5'-phosphate oxidase N-terminal domain-containing protein n=1 Tax=hydrothermal vent metagenome TaxID=652676 RepID=A0A3B0ZKJ8_9ZZZZ
MGKQFNRISDDLMEFISNQRMYFVGTAGDSGKVNISPKGMDSLSVLDGNRVIWLNVTGSSNETSAHVQENPRMTLMFCSFEGKPMILRLYGNATVVHKNDREWEELSQLLPDIPGARQIFDLEVELVQTSCGLSVPFYDYLGEREQLKEWALKKGTQGVQEYWEKNNQMSLDGKPTNIMERNT